MTDDYGFSLRKKVRVRRTDADQSGHIGGGGRAQEKARMPGDFFKLLEGFLKSAQMVELGQKVAQGATQAPKQKKQTQGFKRELWRAKLPPMVPYPST